MVEVFHNKICYNSKKKKKKTKNKKKEKNKKKTMSPKGDIDKNGWLRHCDFEKNITATLHPCFKHQSIDYYIITSSILLRF